MVRKEIRRERVNEIIEFARKNNSRISFSTVVDILKDKDGIIEDGQISLIIEELEACGIMLGRENDEDYPAEEIEEEVFIPADVNIAQTSINVYNLMERLENNEINLKPGFQRNGNLWSLEKQSQLIESLMLKIPIPAFYFNATDEDSWIVIDGLQRLTAFQNYLVGELQEDGTRKKEEFQKLQYLKDFNGFTFDDLPRQYTRRIKETVVIAFTVEKGTPDEVVYNIFQRINTGGVVLNNQEIRQAMYQGTATKLIQKLAESEEFLQATQNAVPPERMMDREYVTRFLAFTELDYRKEYRGNIDNYLIKLLKLVNTYTEDKVMEAEKHFKKIMRYCCGIFGKYAFRKYNEKWHRGPINKAIFEMWAVCFSELTDAQLDKLVLARELFLKRFQVLLQNKEFITALKAGDQYSTARRIEMGRNLVKEFL